MKIAILQRVIPGYRRALFKELSSNEFNEIKLFIGDDIPNSKVKNSKDLSGINFVKSKTSFINLKKRVLVWHTDLITNLVFFKPDVIICEGESHFLGYLQAIIYKLIYNRKVKLIHWCFISLPGENIYNNNIRHFIKAFFRNFFNGFLVYSTFSKNCLIKLGQPPEKIFVSTNVGDVVTHINKCDAIFESKEDIRNTLKIPKNHFTVLYLGTLDANKRPDIIPDIAELAKFDNINFLILGDGPQFKTIENKILNYKLDNVHLIGQVIDNVSLYCKASDLLIIPGRGGIVISEAMSYEMAVLVHQCDGTEYDLVIPDKSGYILENGDPLSFYRKIKFLSENKQTCINMGKFGKEMIKNMYNTDNMVKNILAATSCIYKN